MRARAFQLRRRPTGTPTPDNFELVEVDLPVPAEGQLLVRNLFLSVDPYMRGRMQGGKSYVPPFELGRPLEGAAVGRVERSRHPDFAEGDLVRSMQGWRDAFVSDGRGLRKLDPSLPPQAYLGTLGMPGLTAYVGLLDIGHQREGEGETVLVSAAAGAVGSVACQIARARGCRVVGVVGAEAKARWLLEHGCVDVALNYRAEPDLRAAIGRAAPEGVHLTFENVGGAHLEAALACARDFGRVVLCGLIAEYNIAAPQLSPRNFRAILVKRLTVRGFIVSDHRQREPDFLRDMTGWIREGKVIWTETIVESLERMPEAFIGLFEGKNLGKMLVRV